MGRRSLRAVLLLLGASLSAAIGSGALASTPRPSVTVASRDRMLHAVIRVPPGIRSLRFSLRNRTTGQTFAESTDLLSPGPTTRIYEADEDPFVEMAAESGVSGPPPDDVVIVRDKDDRRTFHAYTIFDEVGEVELQVRWEGQAASFLHQLAREEDFGGLIDTTSRFVNEDLPPAVGGAPEPAAKPAKTPAGKGRPGQTPAKPEGRLGYLPPAERVRVQEVLAPLRGRGVEAVPELLELVARSKPDMGPRTRVVMSECDDPDPFWTSAAAPQSEALCLLRALGSAAAPTLNRVAMSDGDRAERRIAIQALGFVGNVDSPAVLLELLGADDGQWEGDAEDSLRNLGPAATDALIAAASPEAPHRTASVFWVLKERVGHTIRPEEGMSREEAVRVFRRALDFVGHRHDRVRIWSQALVGDLLSERFAWGMLPDLDPDAVPAAVPPLIRALDEPDEYTVKHVLGVITGLRDSGLWPASQWRAWYLDRWRPGRASSGLRAGDGQPPAGVRDLQGRLELAAALDPAELECSLLLGRHDTPGRAAADELRLSGGEGAEFLAVTAAGSPSAAVRRAAVILLGFVPRDRSLRALVTLIGSAAAEEAALADEATRALARLGNAAYGLPGDRTPEGTPGKAWKKRVTSATLDLFHGGSAPARLNALRALRNIRSNEVPLDELFKAMRDPDPGVRAYAVIVPAAFDVSMDYPWAWGGETWPSLHLQLVGRLDDPSAEVRTGALRTLNMVPGNQKDAPAWREWARKQGR